MNREHDFISSLEDYLEEFDGATPLPDETRDAVRAELPTIRQLPAWWPGRRLPEMNNIVKLSVAAAAVVIAALVGFNYLIAPNVGDPGIDDPAPTASPSASIPSPIPLTFAERDIDPGTYTLDDAFPVRITFDVPAGFRSCSAGESQQGVCGNPSTEAPSGRGVVFWIVDNAVTDPCSPAPHDPPVGPSVDDLVEALSSLPGFTATAPVDVTLDGQSGKQIELTAPTDAGCALQTWSTANGTNGVGPGERNLLWVADVDGVRLMISMAYFPDDTPQSVLDELQEIVDSVRFD